MKSAIIIRVIRKKEVESHIPFGSLGFDLRHALVAESHQAITMRAHSNVALALATVAAVAAVVLAVFRRRMGHTSASK